MSSDRRRHGSFEDRFVAFVDILGFRDIVSRMQKEHGLFSTVRDALKTSRRFKSPHAETAYWAPAGAKAKEKVGLLWPQRLKPC